MFEGRTGAEALTAKPAAEFDVVVVDVVDAAALRFLGPTDGFKATLRWFHGVRGGPGVAGGEGNRRRSLSPVMHPWRSSNGGAALG